MHPNALISRIESTAPPSLAASWDRCGVQIASHSSEIRTVCVALDPSVETVNRAVEAGAEFLLCHHPLTLAPKLPDKLDDYHHVLSLALSRGLWVYSAHTSLDANPTGPVNWLGRSLELESMRVLDVTQTQSQILVQLQDLINSDVRAELAQFAPVARLKDAYLLWPEELERFRRCVAGCLYVELPATSPRREFGFGCIGILPTPMTWPEFSDQLSRRLQTSWRAVGKLPDRISSVAYCPGSGADLAHVAFAHGADVYLTGDLKYHQAQSLQDRGLTLDVGHFCLEESMMRVWCEDLAHELAQDNIRVMFLPGRDPFF